jgi:hypothetical protein
MSEVRRGTMSEVLERAAAAAYGHFFCDDWPPKQAPDLGMEADAWREAVRKAIAAIREPNATTKTAGYYGARFADGATIEDAGECWRQMIDAILTPSTISILTPGTLSKKGD